MDQLAVNKKGGVTSVSNFFSGNGVVYVDIDDVPQGTWIMTSSKSFWPQLSKQLTGHELTSLNDINRVLADQGRGQLFEVPVAAFTNFLEI